jgi:hypothetical protein
MATETSIPRSRRALLAAAAGGLGALLATALGRPLPARGAAGSPLILGSTTNSAGTSNTALSTSSTGTALLVTQNGSGTALRGSAVGAGSIAGFFTASNGTGISGVTGNPASYGVYGANDGAVGSGGAVRANGQNSHGLVATTNHAQHYAVYAVQNAASTGDGAAILALAANNDGLVAVSDDAASVAIRAVQTGVNGTVALFENTSGGTGFNAGPALRAYSGGGSNADVHPGGGFVDAAGEFAGPNGVIGASALDGDGVIGLASSGSGVRGESISGAGVYGSSTSGDGVVGFSSGGYALHGVGNGAVDGSFSKAGGSFKIDHPLAPSTKYLRHSFVESPDMKNVYDGVVTLDAKGQATVALPAYFETLNRDFRYQLTPLGAFSPLYVKATVAKGRFTIAGGTPGQEVCWQLTGIRKDPWAEAHRIVVEETKRGKERGLYLHPELYGQPEVKGLATLRLPRKLQHTAG